MLELRMENLNNLGFSFCVCNFFRNEMIKASKVNFRAYSDSYSSSLWLLSVLRNERHGRSVEKVVLSDFLETENVSLNFSKNLKSWAFYWRNMKLKMMCFISIAFRKSLCLRRPNNFGMPCPFSFTFFYVFLCHDVYSFIFFHFFQFFSKIFLTSISVSLTYFSLFCINWLL